MSSLIILLIMEALTDMPASRTTDSMIGTGPIIISVVLLRKSSSSYDNLHLQFIQQLAKNELLNPTTTKTTWKEYMDAERRCHSAVAAAAAMAV